MVRNNASRQRLHNKVLCCAICSALGLVVPGRNAFAQQQARPPVPGQFAPARSSILVAPAQTVGQIQLETERDSLPADGQTVANLSIRVLDVAGNLSTQDTVVTVEASNGVLQLPGARTDEAGLGKLDSDPVTPGVQLVVHNGVAKVGLKAPIEPTTVTVQVSAGQALAKGKIQFIPALRDMVAVGLVDGIVRFDRKNPLALSQARPNDDFEDRINSWSRQSGDGKRDAALRTAFFLKGRVKGNALLTMAYDSDKPDSNQLFRDLDPERWFPVYGDASIVGFEARSNSRLYLRLDKGRNYLMYGDIATGDGFSQHYGQGNVADTRTRDLGQYNRAMTGIRGHLENDRGAMDVFASYDTLRQIVEEFPGRGLSGPYTVSNSTYAVLGSERVEVITRDRNAPARIINVDTMGRFNDYSFEPFSGRIIFTHPIPSVDENLNPVSVRITYEVEQGGQKYWVYGANGQYRINKFLEVGGSFVRDQNPLAPFELASANATVNFDRNTWLRGEVARTRSDESALGGNIYTLDPNANGARVSGDAWRAEFGHNGERFDFLAWYGESDRNFNNPAASFLGGRREGGLNAAWLLGGDKGKTHARWSLYAQGNYIEDRLTDADRMQAQAGVRYQPNERFILEVGANHVSEHSGNGGANGLVVPGNLNAPYGVGVVTPGFGGGFFGGSSNAINPGTGQTLYNTGSSWSGGYGSWVGNGLAGVPVAYTALRVAAQYKPNARFDLSGEVEQDVDHIEHRRASLGVGWRVHDQTRLYGRYEWNTGLSTVATSDQVRDPTTGASTASPYNSDALVFGIETQYMQGGSVFNEYRMYDAYGARQAQMASGIRNRWNLSPNFSMETGFEHLQVLDGNAQKSTAATFAFDWRPSELWLVNSRLEWRRSGAINNSGAVVGAPTASWLNSGYDSWLSTATVARKLNRDWTAMFRNYYLLNDYQGNRKSSYENRTQFGFAYRDTDTNRLNVLGKYEYWTRRDYSMDDWLQDSTGEAALTPASNGYDKHIVSVLADWHPNRVWWVTGRLAGKQQTDYFAQSRDKFRAYLVGARVTYGLSERWDVSGATYQMWTPGGARQYAIGAEVGYMITSNLWLSAGYNVRGFRDDELSGGEYTNQGVFLRLRFKFDENLFKGNSRDVNRSLPR